MESVCLVVMNVGTSMKITKIRMSLKLNKKRNVLHVRRIFQLNMISWSIREEIMTVRPLALSSRRECVIEVLKNVHSSI